MRFDIKEYIATYSFCVEYHDCSSCIVLRWKEDKVLKADSYEEAVFEAENFCCRKLDSERIYLEGVRVK